MPEPFILRVPEDDLAPVRAAHQRLRRHFGDEAMPLEMLALVALRSVDPEFLADEVRNALKDQAAEEPAVA